MARKMCHVIGPFGYREQSPRPDPPKRGMLPPRQCFGTDQRIVGAGKLRLEQDLDLVTVERT